MLNINGIICNFTENSADDEECTVVDAAANANGNQNSIAGDEIEPAGQIAGIESPINTNEPAASDFMENPRVDVQPIDTTMLEEIRRRILDRESILDDSVDLDRSSNDRPSARGVATSVVASGNSSNNTGGLAGPIELSEERFILEEDDTSSDSDSNGSEENDEEREEESNGKSLIIKENSLHLYSVFSIKLESFNEADL